MSLSIEQIVGGMANDQLRLQQAIESEFKSLKKDRKALAEFAEKLLSEFKLCENSDKILYLELFQEFETIRSPDCISDCNSPLCARACRLARF